MRYLCVVAVVFAVVLSGCSGLPEGTQFQSSTFGMRVSPFSPDATPFVLGSHTAIINTPAPPDSGPALNRNDVAAPGIRLKSTVGSGPVGEEIDKAGGPEALQFLMAPDIQTQLPTPISPELIDALKRRQQLPPINGNGNGNSTSAPSPFSES